MTRPLLFLYLLLLSASANAVESLTFICERDEQGYSERYELKLSAANRSYKAKVFVDGRDLDRADDLGQQVVKSVLIADTAALFALETQFPAERFDGIQYGAGSVVSATHINRSNGRMKKSETVTGGILSTTIGNGTRTYEEQCTESQIKQK